MQTQLACLYEKNTVITVEESVEVFLSVFKSENVTTYSEPLTFKVRTVVI